LFPTQYIGIIEEVNESSNSDNNNPLEEEKVEEEDEHKQKVTLSLLQIHLKKL